VKIFYFILKEHCPECIADIFVGHHPISSTSISWMSSISKIPGLGAS